MGTSESKLEGQHVNAPAGKASHGSKQPSGGASESKQDARVWSVTKRFLYAFKLNELWQFIRMDPAMQGIMLNVGGLRSRTKENIVDEIIAAVEQLHPGSSKSKFEDWVACLSPEQQFFIEEKGRTAAQRFLIALTVPDLRNFVRLGPEMKGVSVRVGGFDRRTKKNIVDDIIAVVEQKRPGSRNLDIQQWKALLSPDQQEFIDKKCSTAAGGQEPHHVEDDAPRCDNAGPRLNLLQNF